jgi:hypothetical protein
MQTQKTGGKSGVQAMVEKAADSQQAGSPTPKPCRGITKQPLFGQDSECRAVFPDVAPMQEFSYDAKLNQEAYEQARAWCDANPTHRDEEVLVAIADAYVKGRTSQPPQSPPQGQPGPPIA